MNFRRRSMTCDVFRCSLAVFGVMYCVCIAGADSAPSKAESISVAGAPDVDLRPRFDRWGLPPRLQGKRGTCSVCTMVGALEYAKAMHEGKGSRLSVEYLNWAKNQIASVRKRDGGKFSDLWEGFVESGICLDNDMPYRAKYDRNRGPSPEARAYAEKLARGGYRMQWIKAWNVRNGMTERQFQEIKQVIRGGWPVCGGFRWPKKLQRNESIMQMIPPKGVYDGHSVLVVGYRDDLQLPGGGAFILRDSLSGRDDRMMCYEYARAYLNDALWIESAKTPAVPTESGAETANRKWRQFSRLTGFLPAIGAR